MHDWTRVGANRYHNFHHVWTTTILNALNAGVLPPPFIALAEQTTGGPRPDVVTLEAPRRTDADPFAPGPVMAPPKTRVVTRTKKYNYSLKTNRVSIQHPDGRVVAVIELVSPGNKDSRHAIRNFARKAARLLRAGIHLLIADPFPPGPRDPAGIHKVIWDEIESEPFALPPDKPLTLVSYEAGETITAYIEHYAVGDPLPDMPIYLADEYYVMCPLEQTYLEAWAVFPAVLKGPLEAEPEVKP